MSNMTDGTNVDGSLSGDNLRGERSECLLVELVESLAEKLRFLVNSLFLLLNRRRNEIHVGHCNIIINTQI